MTSQRNRNGYAGVAFCGVTGAGKSTLTDAVALRLFKQPLILLRNEAIQNPGLALFRSDGAAGLTAFLRVQANRIATAVNILDGRGHLVCESFMVNLLAECGITDRHLYTEADSRRAELGILLVRLHLSEQDVLERSVIMTRRYRGAGWGRYLDSLGPTADDQTAVFEQRRQLINQYFAWSSEPKMSISSRTQHWETIADRIVAALRGDSEQQKVEE